MPFKFEKLIVWQKAVDLSDFVNQTTKLFPKEEMYILSSQMKRAADSVSLNIAEGSTGQTNPEFISWNCTSFRNRSCGMYSLGKKKRIYF